MPRAPQKVLRALNIPPALLQDVGPCYRILHLRQESKAYSTQLLSADTLALVPSYLSHHKTFCSALRTPS